MKKIFLINASPRKNYNTAKLLHQFGKGAESTDTSVEVKQVDLYDYSFTGCHECYLCKLRNGRSYKECGYNDDIHGLLKEVSSADMIVFGAPVFLGNIPGILQSFLERLLYPFKLFDKDAPEVDPPHRIPTAFIYTMNVTEEQMIGAGYPRNLTTSKDWVGYVFGIEPKVLYCNNTLQYNDYGRYAADAWDIEGKKKHHEQQFPIDCRKAFDLGKEMVDTL